MFSILIQWLKTIVQMKKLVKVDAVMDGDIGPFIEAYLRKEMDNEEV